MGYSRRTYRGDALAHDFPEPGKSTWENRGICGRYATPGVLTRKKPWKERIVIGEYGDTFVVRGFMFC
jgi:hypothetical protein